MAFRLLLGFSFSSSAAFFFSCFAATSSLFVVGQKFLFRDLLVGDRNLRQQMVDDLFLEQRSAQIGERGGIVAIELVDFLLLVGRKTAYRLEKRTLEFLFAHLHARFLADLRENQAEPHTALCKALILGARLLFSRLLVGKSASGGFEVASSPGPRYCWNSASTRLEGASNL